MEQYIALVQAIADGAFRVKYQDKEVTYRSQSDMLALKRAMEADLGIGDNSDGGARRTIAVHSKGL